MLSSYLLALPLLAVGAMAQIQPRDFAIQGCVLPTAILSVTGSPAAGINLLNGLYTTESSCATACDTAGYDYAYFLGGATSTLVTTCACSNTPPQISQLVTATAAVNGALDAGICGTANFEAISINPNFQLRACAFADAFTSTAVVPVGNGIGNADSCLNSCTGYAYALVGLAGTGSCSCASGTSIVNAARLGACSKTGANTAIYFNNDFPVASLVARRRNLERSQLPLGLCPTGLQACLVNDSSSSATDAFECLDTRSELESCGGCVYGLADSSNGIAGAITGVDCSSLPGVALGGSTCTLGKCEVFACKKGHTLVAGRCQPRH